MKLIKGVIVAIVFVALSNNVTAAINFSDLKFTQNSFSFTANGDFSGLTPPDMVGYRTGLSIIFDSSFKNPSASVDVGYDTQAFDLTTSPFLNTQTDSALGLKWYETVIPDSAYNYTTLFFQNDTQTLTTLDGLQGNGTPYTLTFDEATFDLSQGGKVTFAWGYGAYKDSIFPTGNYFTEIQTVAVSPVSEPTTLWLMIGGLAIISLLTTSFRKK